MVKINLIKISLFWSCIVNRNKRWLGNNEMKIYYSDHYWPMDTVPVYYGDIKVTLLNESHYADWLITEFMMQRVSLMNIDCVLKGNLSWKLKIDWGILGVWGC